MLQLFNHKYGSTGVIVAITRAINGIADFTDEEKSAAIQKIKKIIEEYENSSHSTK